jgi:signal transduction histidine kinase
MVIESPYGLQRQSILIARAQSVGLVFLCIVLIVVLGLLYSRGINRNFRQLIKGIQAIAQGHYSRKIRLITQSWTPYEIVYLTAEFNRMADQIAAADDLKSTLIDTVSHELRTPLTSIKGYTSRLIRLEDTIDVATRLKSLKVIKQQTERLSRLVDDLLVIPDLEREGGLRVFPDRVNLTELLEHTVLLVQDKAEQRVHLDMSPNPLDILADPDRMEQVLLNLLDNAVKYAPPDALIQVSLKQNTQNSAQIILFNPCDPIVPDVMATLFGKFTRLDSRLTRTTRGSGLGLFITRSLLEAMGGTIQLDGREGFRVTVTIPLVSPQAVEAAAITR